MDERKPGKGHILLYGRRVGPNAWNDDRADGLQVDENAFLSMREEYMRMKRKEQEDHQKMREWVLPAASCHTT